METVHGILQDIGEWTGDASVGRGVVTVAGAAAAVLFAGYRWMRGKPKQRSRIIIECEPGERAYARLGSEEEDSKK